MASPVRKTSPYYKDRPTSEEVHFHRRRAADAANLRAEAAAMVLDTSQGPLAGEPGSPDALTGAQTHHARTPASPHRASDVAQPASRLLERFSGGPVSTRSAGFDDFDSYGGAVRSTSSTHQNRSPPDAQIHRHQQQHSPAPRPVVVTDAVPLQPSPTVQAPAAAYSEGIARPECSGCARLRVEVDDLRSVVTSLEATVAKLTFSYRALTNREASAARSHQADLQRDTFWAKEAESIHTVGAHGHSPSPPPPAAYGGASPSSGSGGLGDGLSPSSYSANHLRSTGRAPDPPRDAFEAELQRSNALRSQAAAGDSGQQRNGSQHYAASSPMLRDQQNLVAVKAELRVFEKRIVGAMTKLANRLSAVEGDAATLVDSSEALHESVIRAISEVKAEKVSKSDLKPLVLPIVDTARDVTGERVANIYRLFGWPEARVQQAVSSEHPDRITDTIFSSPSLARLVDGLVRTSNDVSSLRDEVHHLHHVRMVDGPTLAPKQRLLGLAVGDEVDLRGVRVTQVFAGGPGHLAGFRVGDTIATVNSVHVTCKRDFLRVMSGVMPNAVVRIGRIPRGRSVVEEIETIATPDESAATAAPLY